MELENETIMITELPKAIKSDPRKFWRISLAMIGLFTRDNKHSSWQCIGKNQWLFTGQKKHLSFREKKEKQSKALIKSDNK